MLIAGYIHDVSSFVDSHPGGRHVLVNGTGQDTTAAFYGGVYKHSNAAHNVCFSFFFSIFQRRFSLF